MKTLLVGGAGYIGSVLTEHLLRNGIPVRCLDKFIYKNHSAIASFMGAPGYEWIAADVTDAATRREALKDVKHVVILAGLVGDPITKKYPEISSAVNDRALSDLIDDLGRSSVERVIFISTCSNYGLMSEGKLADENSDLKPLSLYAESKVKLEKKILSLKGSVKYTPTILRFATAFGLSPRMRFDLTVSEFTRSLFLNEELVVYDADTWRPYCHVRDFARAITTVLDAPLQKIGFEVFNAGGDINNYTKKMIVDEVLRQLPGRRVQFKEHGQDRRNYRVSFEKIRSVLGFEPQHTIPQGISELIGALEGGFYADASEHRSFYGNYEVQVA